MIFLMNNVYFICFIVCIANGLMGDETTLPLTSDVENPNDEANYDVEVTDVGNGTSVVRVDLQNEEYPLELRIPVERDDPSSEEPLDVEVTIEYSEDNVDQSIEPEVNNCVFSRIFK